MHKYNQVDAALHKYAQRRFWHDYGRINASHLRNPKLYTTRAGTGTPDNHPVVATTEWAKAGAGSLSWLNVFLIALVLTLAYRPAMRALYPHRGSLYL